MKEKIKNIIKKFNKKTIIICCIIFVVIVAVALILIIKPFGKSVTHEGKLTTSLEELGRDFYENFYYNQISKDDEERSQFLEKYTDIGIKINLDNLSRFKSDETEEIKKEFVNDESKEECNLINSMVVIYPKKPYEKTSYSIDVVLECGYKEEKK